MSGLHLWSTQGAVGTTGPPGVAEEGARRKISRGTWEARCGAKESVCAVTAGARGGAGGERRRTEDRGAEAGSAGAAA